MFDLHQEGANLPTYKLQQGGQVMWPTGQPKEQTMTKSQSQLKPVAGSELPLRIPSWVMQKRLTMNWSFKRARMTLPLTGVDGKPTKTGL